MVSVLIKRVEVHQPRRRDLLRYADVVVIRLLHLRRIVRGKLLGAFVVFANFAMVSGGTYCTGGGTNTAA